MDRRGFLRLVGAAGVATGAGTLLVACNANPTQGASASGNTSTPGGTLYILDDTSSVHFDPAKTQGLATTTNGLVHRRLTAWDLSGATAKVVPDLATDTGRASDNGATWTYTLKDGLAFSDGSPITSADIKWGIERTFAAAFSSGLSYHKTLLVGGPSYTGPFSGQGLDSIQTPNAKTIVFHLVRPYGDWPWIASLVSCSPVPNGKGTDASYDQHPITSGPYQVASYSTGVSTTLSRNPHWNRATDKVRTGLPNQIVFQLSQDDSVISQRLVANSGNDQSAIGASFVDPAQLAQLQSNPSAKQRLVTSDAGAVAFLALNTQRGPLTNPAVRKAFQYAVDKTAFQVATAGTPGLAGPIATTLITPGIAGREVYDLYPTAPGGDPAKAKQLLAAAGYPNGLSGLTMLVTTADNGANLAQAVVAALARANIKVVLQPLDDDTYQADVTANQVSYDLTVSSWQPDFPSANANIQPLYDSAEIGNGGYNLARYSNAQVDSMIADAQQTVDPTEAGTKWAAVDKRIMQDSPVVPLIYTRNSFLHGSKVDDFTVPDFPAYPNYLTIGISQ
ncbi:MAG TPA: ABC transporter substrate-binding protein [Pseudonocardiaceae bacterium]|jgi:peptide/nickel transport system substrate-binding protein|nr:ABC transporter substrate-binding protein [Pseudonocardiaceae bacterium]